MKKRKDGRYQRLFTINGKRICFYSSEDTEKKAMRDIEKQMLRYKEKEECGKLFEEVAEEWEEEHFRNIEYTTSQRYKTYKNSICDEFMGRYIKDIQAIEIDMFLQRMAKRNYSSKTIKDQLSVIKMIFRHAVINKYVDEDPSFYIKAVKGKQTEERLPLTTDEVNIVANSIDCTFGFLAYFLLYTGLRKGEALALQFKDIDFENNFINITKSVYFYSNKPIIKPPKTRAGERKVVLLDCVKKKLCSMPHTNENDYIFNIDGEIINKSNFTRRWKKYQEETGLKITAHQLRHTFATILYEANIQAKDAQILMGHSDIKVTQNIYTHIRSSQMAQTANRLNQYLSDKNVVKS